jgi:hypothetical protein
MLNLRPARGIFIAIAARAESALGVPRTRMTMPSSQSPWAVLYTGQRIGMRGTQCPLFGRIGCALGSAADQARGQRPGELPPVQCRGDAGVEERVSGCTAGGQARLR